MKYKIIRKFPYSPEVGSIGIQLPNTDIEFKDLNVIHRYGIKEVESNPEFFAPYLFTTLDNKDIFIGDTFYFIDSSNKFFLSGIATIHSDIRILGKVFSTKEAVQNYIDEQNKPRFEKGEWLYVKMELTKGKIECIGRYNYTKESSHWFSEEYSLRYGDVNTNEFFIQGIQETSWSTAHNVVKADTETIQRILSKVALHKGFKEGVEYKSAFSGDTFTVPFVDFQWDGEGLCTKGENLNGFIYNKGKWAEIIEDVPEYVKCTKSASTTYLENKIYKVNKEGFLKNYVIGEDNRILSLYNRFLKYPNDVSSHFEFSTKEAYDAQFKTKELTITLDGDVVDTSHWGNNVKITYK